MLARNLINEILPHLIMMGFKKYEPAYKDVYEGEIDDELYNDEGWKIKFYVIANFIDLLNLEDNFSKRIPLGKNSLQLLIKTIEDQDKSS